MGKVWAVELWILSSPILKFFKTFRVISHLISLSYLLWNLCWLNDSYALKIGTLAIYLFIYDLLTLSLLLHSLGLAKQGWGDSRLILIVKTLLSFFALDIAGQGLSMSREWFKKKKRWNYNYWKGIPIFCGYSRRTATRHSGGGDHLRTREVWERKRFNNLCGSRATNFWL